MAVDIDADVDAAEIGGIEPDFETALAALGRRGDLHRNAAERHRRACGAVAVSWRAAAGVASGRLLPWIAPAAAGCCRRR